MSAWEDELDEHPEYIDEMLREKMINRAMNADKYFCESCGKIQPFYLQYIGRSYHCLVCGSIYVPQNRDHRRGDNVKKHTWEVNHKRK